MNNKGFDWICPKHNTFGDNGSSCANCGYPLGAKLFELKNGKIKILKKVINLFIGKLFIFDIIDI